MMELYKPVHTIFVTNNTLYFKFIDLMKKNNVQFKDFYEDEVLFDEMLIEATKLTFEKKRIPGKYIYDKEKGEETVQEYEESCQ